MLTFDPAKRTRQNTLDFKPPMPSAWIQRLFHGLLPHICDNVLKGLTIHVDPASLDELRAIQGQRCLILPNHPSEWDPCVLFEVGRRLKENFFFVAAREVFDYSYGLRGWFFQRLGVYSLVRGSNDRKSFKTSMDILAQNRGRLVIFVEGEISNQNQTLLPLESGVIQLAFMALSDLYKANQKNLEALPSLYVCPVGLRYVYEQKGLGKAVEAALHELETSVGLSPNSTAKRYERLHQICLAILTGASAQLGFTPQEGGSMAHNVQQLSDFMLIKLEQLLNLPSDSTISPLDRIRQIRNTVDRVLSQTINEASSDYARRLHAHQKAILKNIYEDLGRLVNFIAIYDGYLQPEMDVDSQVELIRRLEKEVFGEYRLVHPRKAHVTVQDPIDLKTCFPRFLEDKRAVLEELTAVVERGIYDGIQASK